MGTRVFVSEDGFELSRPLTDVELKHIESIKDGWGENAFSAEASDYVVFRLTEMEGADPGTDGIDKPLKELLKYLKEEGITVRGEIFINSDSRDYYYDNTALSVKEDYTIEYEDLALRNMDDKTLIEEFKRRGYEEPVKREEISIWSLKTRKKIEIDKTIKISDELEDKIVRFCDDELNWHINECKPDEYKDEIEAQIALLKLLGHENMARGYEEQYKEATNEKPEDTERQDKDAENWYTFDGFDDKGVITDFIGKHLEDFVGYDPYGSPHGSAYCRACDEMEEYVNNLSDDEVKELATKILTEEEYLYCEGGKIIDDREMESEREQ